MRPGCHAFGESASVVCSVGRMQPTERDVRGGASYTHYQGDTQWQYNDWVAEMTGADVARLALWREAMYMSGGTWKRAHPGDYRDTWRDPPLEAAAEAEFSALCQKLRRLPVSTEQARV